MKNILITGGAGFIGTATVLQLKKTGCQIYVIDHLERGFKTKAHQSVHFIQADLKNLQELAPIFKKYQFDAVIHLAALAFVKESFEKADLYLENNIESTRNLIFLCQKYRVNKMIFSSSCTIYGNENSPVKLDEKSRIQAMSPYGISKVECENLIQSSGIDYLILRYFNVAGPGLRTSFASHLIHQLSRAALNNQAIVINGDGHYVRDYIHVEDVAGIHELGLKYLLSNECREIINCGYGEGFSVLEIIEKFERINQLKLKKQFGPERQGDPDHLVCDPTKLKNLLNWQSKFSHPLEAICQSSLQWEKSLVKESRQDLAL